MKIIDFHAHVYPDKIADRATAAVGEFYDLPMESKGSVTTLLENAGKAGFERSVIHSVATSDHQVMRINDFIASQVSEHPDRLSGFGTLHQDFEDKIGETQRCMSMGLKGIKLHPDTQKFNIDDERFYELYDYMQGRYPLLIHTGDFRYDYSHPRRLKKILGMFPGLTVIGAHFGGWSLWDEAYECLRDENCMVDTSSSSGFMDTGHFERLIKNYGADRVLFGTDFPMWDGSAELERFMRVKISDDEREKILYKNAEAILKIE